MPRLDPALTHSDSDDSSKQEEAFDQTEPTDIDSPKSKAVVRDRDVGDDPVEEEQKQ